MSIEILKERLEEAQDENLTNARVLTVDLVSALEDIAKLQERAKTAIHYYAEIDNLKCQLEHKERQLAEAERRAEELELYKSRYNHTETDVEIMETYAQEQGQRANDAEARAERLEKALGFYANESNYEQHYLPARDALTDSMIQLDKGSVARTTLRKITQAALSDGGEGEAR